MERLIDLAEADWPSAGFIAALRGDFDLLLDLSLRGQ